MPAIRVGFVGRSNSSWPRAAFLPPLDLSGPLGTKYTIIAEDNDVTNIVNAGVDLIVICVETPDHEAIITHAFDGSKAVAAAWPLGKTLRETLEIAEAAHGVRTICGLYAWQNPAVLKAREWVASGKIGRVCSATWMSSKPEEFRAWTPSTSSSIEYTADPSNGATFLTIGIGHHMSAITRVLGPLQSISASSSIIYDAIQLVDENGQAKGDPLRNVSPDQFVANGVFKNHPGALFSGTWRSAVSTTPPSKHDPTLSFVIAGDKGFIKFESYSAGGFFIHLYPPEKLYLNDKEEEMSANPVVGRTWDAYANGAEGECATFDDAAVLHKHIDAISTSAKEGRVVFLDV